MWTKLEIYAYAIVLIAAFLALLGVTSLVIFTIHRHTDIFYNRHVLLYNQESKSVDNFAYNITNSPNITTTQRIYDIIIDTYNTTTNHTHGD